MTATSTIIRGDTALDTIVHGDFRYCHAPHESRLVVRQRDEELVQSRVGETAPVGAVFVADGILGHSHWASLASLSR
jgi:hypothetical protein